MAVRIEPADPASERDMADVAAVETAYWRDVLGPAEPEFPPAEVLAELLSEGRDGVDATAVLARDGGRPVGLAVVDIRTGYGNEHAAWLPDLFVVDGHRRNGVGRRLLDDAVDRARTADRSVLVAGRPAGSDGGEAFAARVGARTSNANRQNRVDVAALDRSMLERWTDDAGTTAAGYSLVAFDDVCPDDLLDAFVEVERAMEDAPRSDALEAWTHSRSTRRAAEAFAARHATTQWVVCARHDATGALAGYTELTFSDRRPWLIKQGDTAVTARHRGHRIGRWLKATNALRVLAERPEARLIETWNDGTNAPMLSINDDMGFRPVATWLDEELAI